MNSRECVRSLISREKAPRSAFWLGNPHPDTWPLYHTYFGTSTEEELRTKLGDDFRWIWPRKFESAYTHPEGRGFFGLEPHKYGNEQAGPFAQAKCLKDIEEYEYWTDPRDLKFDECLAALENAGDCYRASGCWAMFYHDIVDLFGMESYMLNMYDNPELVQAVTDRVCQFYYDANERFFALAGKNVDGFFFGNDLGTQRGLIFGRKQFDEFIVPWLKRFIDQGHRHGYQVILHSCGSIHDVIDQLIDLGTDCLHPVQAKANKMDARTLAKDFGGRITFMGGIDTQELLVNASPDEIRQEVRRVKDLLGPWLIVSPSHEALLPNVPPENVQAMAEAALE